MSQRQKEQPSCVGCVKDPREVSAALKVLSRRSVQKALVLLRSLDKALLQANAFHSNAILSGVRRKNWEESLQLLQEFTCNSCADLVSYNSVMNSLKWRTTLALFSKVKKLSTSQYTKGIQHLTVSCNCLISSGDAWKHSLYSLLMMRMDHLKPDQFSYMGVLDVLQKSRQPLWMRSCHILSSMTKNLVQPDVITWNSVLASDITWQRQLHLLFSMRHLDVVPDRISFHNAFKCNWQGTFSILASALKLQVETSVVTFNTILGYAPWAIATEILDSMASNTIRPDLLSFNAYLDTFDTCDPGLASGVWLAALQSYTRRGLEADSFSVRSAIRIKSQVARETSALAFDGNRWHQGWQQGLSVFRGAQDQGHQKLTPFCSNALLNECSQLSEWKTAIQLLTNSDEFSLSTTMSACERSFQWRQALSLMAAMPVMLLRRDIVCFGAGVSACEKGNQWQLAMGVLSFSNGHTLNANLNDLNDVSVNLFNAVISACGVASEWTHALFLLHLLGSRADVISYNAALSATERASAWQQALHLFAHMHRARFTDSISFNAVVTACDKMNKWEQVLLLLADESTPGGVQLFALCRDLPKVEKSELEFNAQILWRLAKTAQLSMFDIAPFHLIRAWHRAESLGLLDATQISELVTCLWSMAVLNVQDEKFLLLAIERLRKMLAAGQHKRLPTKSLGNLLWALGSLVGRGSHLSIDASVEIQLYHVLQEEFLSRETTASIALQVLWASAFSKQISKSILSKIKSSVLGFADSLDKASTTGTARNEPLRSIGKWTQPTENLSTPHLVKVLQRRLVVLKPAGWQVDDSETLKDSSHLLSGFLSSLLPLSEQRLLGDLKHRRGFLHRLDVPTSGLILVATSYKAYYDLQLQLVSGHMKRDYVVLCHGLSCPTRIEANVHWLEDGPAWLSGSRVLPYGKPALTLLETIASTASRHSVVDRSLSKVRALSLIMIRILTGRCHQIRLHTAHAGHPVVTDGRYSSLATFEEDLHWCPRNFLHRHSLEFYSTLSWNAPTQVVEPLPADLKLVLERLHLAGRCAEKQSSSDSNLTPSISQNKAAIFGNISWQDA